MGRKQASKRFKSATRKSVKERAKRFARHECEEKTEEQVDVPATSSSPAKTPSSTKTTSEKKLGYGRRVEQPTLRHNQEFSTTIVHLETLQSLFSGVICSVCGGKVILQQDMKASKGLAVFLRSVCSECHNNCGATYTSRRVTSHAPEVNRAIVAASVSVGIGQQQLMKMCEILGMPSVTLKTFQKITKLVHKKAKETLVSTTASARDIIKELYEPDEDGFRNITVSYDGTWHKRGHTSLHGAAAVICAVTGLVIDTHVMSLHCQACKTKEKQLGEDKDAFEKWHREHAANCHKNFNGSSGAMEVEAAKILWTRSKNMRLRYTTMISDGDCKTYNALQTLRPYGDIAIEKAECVNHVAKRLGTALRNLVAEEKKRGVTLGGRGDGTLTQEKIGRLQAYYTKAVRTHNGSVDEMKQGILATFDHCTSTDEAPKHGSCPSGTSSWCFYQRAQAHGEAPGTHKKHLSSHLNPTVAAYVKKVYNRLTDDQLLSKCLLGKTQNANESFHSQIWLRCPKHIFVARPRVEVATALAVGEWNRGAVATHTFMFNLSLEISQTTIQLGRIRDNSRLKKAQGAQEEVKKRRREVQKAARQRVLEEEQKDGGPAYQAGAY